MIEINKIYNENCLDTLNRMDSALIDIVVTSPPYDNLRTYEGFVFPFEDIARELYRVIKPGGVVVWVVSDATINGSETGTSFRQALYFKEIGFNLHDTMIYQKQATPFPDNSRYYSIFEYMFIFSKGKPKTFNQICDRKNIEAGNRIIGTTNRKRDGSLIKTHAETNHTLRDIKPFGARFNVWRYNVGQGHTHTDQEGYKHPATFPEKLAADHIVSWSNENDLVYDPFMGSGTTAKMAYLLKRNYLGSEISTKYCAIAEERLANAKHNLFEMAEKEIA